VLRSPSGAAVAPAPRGEPLTTEQYDALPEPIKQEVQARGAALHEKLGYPPIPVRRLPVHAGTA
jgi:hypothetical protein